MAFYDDRSHLEECVAQYAIDGLRADETVVLILAGRSRDTVTTILSSHGFAVAELVANGRVTLFDSDDTFARINGPDGLDWASLASLANDVVDTAFRLGRPVRLFGEMVVLLWIDGRVDEAMELERFWHALSGHRRFDVLCAYPSSVAADVVDPMNTMCGLHDHAVSIRDGRHQVDVSWYPCERSSVRRARHHVHSLLAPAVQRDALDDADLIVSELAANAVHHARTSFSVEVRQENGLAWVCVRDGHSAVPVLRHTSTTAAGGRGLALIDAVARSWGVIPTPTGKQVWATIATP